MKKINQPSKKLPMTTETVRPLATLAAIGGGALSSDPMQSRFCPSVGCP